MILIISAVFPPEPVVSAMISNDLAFALSKSAKVTVLCPKPTRPKNYQFNELPEEEYSFDKVVLNSFTCPDSRILGRFRESYSFGRHAAKFIRAHKQEITGIYLNGWPMVAPVLIIRTSKRFSIPVFKQVMDVYPESLFRKRTVLGQLFLKLLLPIDNYILTNSSRVITISPGMKDYLLKTRPINEDSIQVVYNWTDEKAFGELTEHTVHQDNSEFTFMFLGSLSPSAAVEIPIEAFATFNCSSSRLIIAGDGSQKQRLQSLADSYSSSRIEFREAPGDQAPAILQNADILVLSLKKGAGQFALPSKLTSYMLSKRPILGIVDKDSDTAKVIISAGCGWIVSPKDIGAIVERMNYVSNLPQEELDAIGMRGYSYAVNHFSKQRNLNKMVDIFRHF